MTSKDSIICPFCKQTKSKVMGTSGKVITLDMMIYLLHVIVAEKILL